MTSPRNRYPSFLRWCPALYAVLVLAFVTPAHAVPRERDPLEEGAEELPHLVSPDAGTREPPPVAVGEVIVARPLTREARATLAITVEESYARLVARSVVENRGPFGSPLTVITHAPTAVVARAACGDGCTATVTQSDGRVRVQTSPDLAPGATRTVTLELLVPTERLRGNVRFTLPPRGADTRAAPWVLSAPLEADATASGVRFRPTGLEVSPFAAVRFVAPRPALSGASLLRARGGTRLVVSMPVREARPARVAIVVDGSPSTTGAARNAITRALTQLLLTMPQDTEITVVEVASVAVRLLPWTKVHDVNGLRLLDALGGAPGNSTRLDRAFALLAEDELDRVVVLGDGGLTRVSGRGAPLRGREIAYVLLGERSPSPTLSALVAEARIELIDARAFGAAAVLDHDEGPFADVLLTALAPRARAVVRDGRTVVTESWLGPGDSLVVTTPLVRPTVTVNGRRLTVAERSLTEPALPGVLTRALPSAAAPAGRDLPRETLLEALRRQFIPPARLCLRSDRRGRAQYSVRAELVVRLAHREVTEIAVNGALAEPLRVCLGEALEQLVLPAAAAPMIVRYPIHTLEAETPPVLELDDETETLLERSMSGERR